MNNSARFGVDSVTYAMQARDLLATRGISANVIRLNKGESSMGCAFGIELSRRDVPAASSLLDKADIPHRIFNR